MTYPQYPGQQFPAGPAHHTPAHHTPAHQIPADGTAVAAAVLAIVCGIAAFIGAMCGIIAIVHEEIVSGGATVVLNLGVTGFLLAGAVGALRSRPAARMCLIVGSALAIVELFAATVLPEVDVYLLRMAGPDTLRAFALRGLPWLAVTIGILVLAVSLRRGVRPVPRW
ncbi:hypothetical protein [Amycolatopsis sp. NPDC051372]|uniref:hypothetical protein n=1 Tax=Amycolatopsis sp. NPDC051372 TaxID=3155669 RepID=UPI00342E5AB6